jgi:hypothetical protein
MPWINGRWVEEEEQDWLNNMGIYDDLLSKKAIYDKGPGHPTVLKELVKTLEDQRDGDGVTPGYNPGRDASIINESMNMQSRTPAAATSLFSMPAPYQRYVAPQQQVRYMAPRTPMTPTPIDPTYGLAASDPNLQGVTPFSMASTTARPPMMPPPPQRMMPPLNIPGRLPAPVQQPIYDRGPQMQPPVPPQFPSLPPQMTFDPPPRPPEFQPFPPPQPPVRPPFINPPSIARPPRPPVRPPMVLPPPPPPIIAQPPRQRPKPPPRPKPTPPPKRKAAPPKRVKRTVASKPPATRPGRTQEGRGPRGARTITGVSRSQNTQRGDR